MSYDGLGRFPYILGGLSFISLIGVFFGILAILWGLIKIMLFVSDLFLKCI